MLALTAELQLAFKKEMSAYEELIKSVNAKAMEFNTHLATVKTANDAIVEKSSEILQALSELLGSARPPQVKKCAVCYTREQRVACVPCGHVFCQSCADRGRRSSRCHSCRQPIEDVMRVYF